MGALRHLVAILVLPFTVTVVLPGLALWWRGAPYVRAEPVVVIACGVLALVSLWFLVWTVGLFALKGRGTLAPWAPPERLVVAGPYRRVRNPMIQAVFGLLTFEAVVTASLPIVALLVVFFVANLVYIPLVEEPRLLRRFGEDYAVYARNVPALTPRLTAWDGSDRGTPRRDPTDPLVTVVPPERLRSVAAVHCIAVVTAAAALALILVTISGHGAPAHWALLAAAATWATMDLRDAWIDALREPPPDLVFGRLLDDDATFEVRDAPDGRPVSGWRFVRREKGAFVLMRQRLASRALVKGVRPADRPFRMAVLYEPVGKPDDDGWIRYPASAAWEDPPGAWRPVAG